MKTVVIAETEKAARELCAGARAAGEVVLVAVAGAAAVGGCADRVLRLAVPEGALPDDAYETIAGIVSSEGARAVYAEASRRVKNIAGMVAARLGTAAVTDVVEIDGAVGTSRYFGGVAQIKQRPLGPVAVYTFGAGTFDAAAATGTDVVEDVEWVAPACAARVVSCEELPPKSVDLTESATIVAAGRGFGAQEDLGLARALCDRIGAGMGCTRPIAEAEGWMPKETYIGVSGLMLAPAVYVGLGTSGQMQHMVGVNRAKTIFAVNKDKNAPIFKQCDYGLVGDVKEVLPALTAQL